MFLGLRNEIVVYLTWMLCSRQCRAFNHSELQIIDVYPSYFHIISKGLDSAQREHLGI